VGLSFIGPKWSDGLLLSLGYSYEQARGPLPPPRFLRAIEEDPAIADMLDGYRNDIVPTGTKR
jgi:amidase